MLEVKNLTKYFVIEKRKKLLFSNLSFVLPDNGMYFISGNSGCGKSTLLSLLSLLDKPNGGYIKLNGKRIDKLNEIEKENFYKKDIGILFQSFNLINDLSIKDNLTLSSKIKDKNGIYKEIELLLIKFNLIDKLNQKVYTLSGGEKQRVALIRSLINEPKIIFADEPTGALDELNSKFLMDELKRLSIKCLVIVVSHDEELVNKYNDGIIKFEKDEIKLININKEINEFNKEKGSKKVISSLKIFYELLKRNLIKNFSKNILIIISLIFSIIFSLFSLSFYFSISSYSSILYKEFIDYDIFEIYKSYNKNTSSTLSIEKKERLDFENIESFLINNEIKEYELLHNFSFFFSDNEVILNNQNYKNISFSPILKISNYDCLVNDAFISTYLDGKLEENTLINIKSSHEYTYYSSLINDEIKEEINIDLTLNIIGKVNEFSFLSTPKIYYSYNGIKDYLSNKLAFNISTLENRDISYYELLTNSKNNESINGYSSFIYIKNDKDVIKINDYIKKKKIINNIRISSNSNTIVTSFLSLLDTIFFILIIFIILIFLTSVFIIFSISFYNYLSIKKERALLKVLGANEKSITFISISEIIFLFLFSYLISYSLNNFLLPFINNKIIETLSFSFKINSNNLINIGLFIFYIFFVILFSYLPIKKNKDINLIKELREE